MRPTHRPLLQRVPNREHRCSQPAYAAALFSLHASMTNVGHHFFLMPAITFMLRVLPSLLAHAQSSAASPPIGSPFHPLATSLNGHIDPRLPHLVGAAATRSSLYMCPGAQQWMGQQSGRIVSVRWARRANGPPPSGIDARIRPFIGRRVSP